MSPVKTITYEIQASEEMHRRIQKLIGLLEACGEAGTCREVAVYFDGDGSDFINLVTPELPPDIRWEAETAVENFDGDYFVVTDNRIYEDYSYRSPPQPVQISMISLIENGILFVGDKEKDRFE